MGRLTVDRIIIVCMACFCVYLLVKAELRERHHKEVEAYYYKHLAPIKTWADKYAEPELQTLKDRPNWTEEEIGDIAVKATEELIEVIAAKEAKDVVKNYVNKDSVKKEKHGELWPTRRWGGWGSGYPY